VPSFEALVEIRRLCYVSDSTLAGIHGPRVFVAASADASACSMAVS